MQIFSPEPWIVSGKENTGKKGKEKDPKESLLKKKQRQNKNTPMCKRRVSSG